MAYDNDTDYYCDHCEAYLNDQAGFTTITGRWICTECDTENDVSENNSYDLLDLFKRGITEIITNTTDDEDD